MAINHNLIKKIDSKSKGNKNLAKDLKVILNTCEEGRQTKKVIEKMLNKL